MRHYAGPFMGPDHSRAAEIDGSLAPDRHIQSDHMWACRDAASIHQNRGSRRIRPKPHLATHSRLAAAAAGAVEAGHSLRTLRLRVRV